MSARPELTPEQQRDVENAMYMVERLARREARRRRRPDLVDDYISEGAHALANARFRFDSASDTPFEGYAFQRVKGAIHDYALKESRPLAERVRRALELGAETLPAEEEANEAQAIHGTPEDARAAAQGFARDYATALVAAYLLADGPPDPLEALVVATERARERGAVLGALDRLPAEDSQLIQRHYVDGVPLKEMARERGVAERTVQRHHARLLAMLRHALSTVARREAR
jgi:RNA polymerase sigma factor FliA